MIEQVCQVKSELEKYNISQKLPVFARFKEHRKIQKTVDYYNNSNVGWNNKDMIQKQINKQYILEKEQKQKLAKERKEYLESLDRCSVKEHYKAFIKRNKEEAKHRTQDRKNETNSLMIDSYQNISQNGYDASRQQSINTIKSFNTISKKHPVYGYPENK